MFTLRHNNHHHFCPTSCVIFQHKIDDAMKALYLFSSFSSVDLVLLLPLLIVLQLLQNGSHAFPTQAGHCQPGKKIYQKHQVIMST